MIFYKNRKWHMCSEKIRYMQHGEEIEQFVGAEGHDWWIDFEQKHEHTEIIEFVDVVATNEQLARLDEVNQLNIGDGFGEMLGNYVRDGIFPDGFTHPLRNLQLQKEQELQDSYLLDLDFRQSITEMGV